MSKPAVYQAILICYATLLLIVPTIASQPNLIMPGYGIGQVKIGIGSVIPKSLGPAQYEDGASGHFYKEWQFPHSRGHGKAILGVFTERNDAGDQAPVTQIRIESSWFTTSTGISTHSSLAQIRKQFRHLSFAGYVFQTSKTDRRFAIDVYDDTRDGIAFCIWGKASQSIGKCAAIYVHRRGKSVAVIDMIQAKGITR